jgi:hypothetical protein
MREAKPGRGCSAIYGWMDKTHQNILWKRFPIFNVKGGYTRYKTTPIIW